MEIAQTSTSPLTRLIRPQVIGYKRLAGAIVDVVGVCNFAKVGLRGHLHEVTQTGIFKDSVVTPGASGISQVIYGVRCCHERVLLRSRSVSLGAGVAV